MHLYEALRQTASQFGWDKTLATVLIDFTSEDEIGGYHSDPRQQKWPVGSMWGVEGQVLYALVRALKPNRVLELGTFAGCSATHIASALKANGSGELVCVDNGHDNHRLPEIGYLIPDELRYLITVVKADQMTFLRDAEDSSYNLIFEDGLHSYEGVKATWAEIPRVLASGSVALSHDALHEVVGEDVMAGIVDAGITDYRTYMIEPADCGFAVWMKP